MEPHNLKRWRVVTSPKIIAHFFTCARPGRSKGPKGSVSDDLVSTWVRGLPGPKTVVISLLGRKSGPKKRSEFSFYSFCGGFDTPSERGNQPTFQEWLDDRHEALQILLREHPTIDCPKVPYERLDAIAREVCDLIREGHSVVVVDSGGVQRTGAVSRHMNATEVALVAPTPSKLDRSEDAG